MRSGAFYDDLSELNDNLYGGAKDYKDFKLIDVFDDRETGAYVALYKKHNEYFLCVRGTQFNPAIKDMDIKDLEDDLRLWATKHTEQAKKISEYFLKIKPKYNKIVFSSYSLGGSVAQELCLKFGNETICFEPYGIGKASGNCINFGNLWDIVFMQNPNGMVGETYIIPMTMPKSGRRDLTTHYPKCHGKPSTAKKYTQPLEDNITYFKRISMDKIKPYIKSGIIN